jgi:hypothetical protein
MNDIPLQLKLFNDKVRAMNQANAKLLTLNVDEARNLQAEIFNLLAIIAANASTPSEPQTTVVKMDGGGF